MATESGDAVVLRGLLIDFGGVLTTDVFESFVQFSESEGLPPETVRNLFRNDPAARDLLAQLETGEVSNADFERRFAVMLGVDGERLIDRLFNGMGADQPMLDAVRAARAAGIRTGLISNSWGADGYDRALLDELFDGIVISGDVGVRKPDARIYELGVRAIGLTPQECVFVDDLPGNLKPARALGMTTVHHRSAEETVAELERLFGVALR